MRYLTVNKDEQLILVEADENGVIIGTADASGIIEKPVPDSLLPLLAEEIQPRLSDFFSSVARSAFDRIRKSL